MSSTAAHASRLSFGPVLCLRLSVDSDLTPFIGIGHDHPATAYRQVYPVVSGVLRFDR